MPWSCAAAENAQPQGLSLVYWFDASPDGDPYQVRVRLTGRRLAEDGSPTADQFEVVRTVDRVLPGSGRIALSTHVPDIPTGLWQVTAEPVNGPWTDSSTTPRPAPLPKGTATGNTFFAPVARVRAPGVRLGAWPSLVASGATVALLLQLVLAAQRRLPTGRLLALSLLAALTGLVGARAYYVLTHRSERRTRLQAGMSVQGFIIAAIAVLLLGGWWARLPVAVMLDLTTPGLLFGLAIGRLGCFFGGCCAGRPTASRFGLWSSDRAVGVRRIPVQLMESTLACAIATAALAVVLLTRPPVGGLLFVAGLSAYIAGRQLLFPLRSTPRLTSWGRQTTLVLAALLLCVTVSWSIVSTR